MVVTLSTRVGEPNGGFKPSRYSLVAPIALKDLSNNSRGPRRVDGGAMTKNRILLVVVLLAAYGVGFALGMSLWEEDVAPPGPSEPGPHITRRA